MKHKKLKFLSRDHNAPSPPLSLRGGRGSYKIGTIADPISKFDPVAETTSFILHEAGLRGHELWMMEIGDIIVDCRGERPFARTRVLADAKKVTISKIGNKFSYKIISKKMMPLDRLDILFLRKDPPVNMAYINHLTMLEMLELCNSPSPPLKLRGGRGALSLTEGMTPLLVNSPSGIKRANEKIFPLRFPGISPPTLVSSSLEVMWQFLKEHKKCVLKPLNQGGGRGIFFVPWRDPDVSRLFKMATKNFTEQVLLQKYLPEAKKGDKRVLLLDGKILGYFLRIPKKGDFRANLHQGGRFMRTTLSTHDKKLIKRVVPSLKTAGLHFVGIDIIGNYVTEINVTSPMGVREVNQIDNSQIEKKIVNWAEIACF